MESKVHVVVRLRPGNTGATPCARVTQTKAKLVHPNTNDAISYSFDGCYGPSSTQECIYKERVEPVLPTLFDGFNTSVFAYGNTGAGKTHTMQGTLSSPGIIPQAAQRLISLAESKEDTTITVSYLEIYKDKVYDLLQPKPKDLPIRQNAEGEIFIPSLSESPIVSMEQFQQVYQAGCKNRTTAATQLNSVSSRSHAVLLMKVEREDKATSQRLRGKLHLIDLAGSEDNRRTANTGVRLVESSNINTSLFVLGKVVNALNSGGSQRVPYRDSKLTRLLQDSLGGKARAILVACIDPSAASYSHTCNTLNFASKSRTVVNRVEAHSEDVAKEREAERLQRLQASAKDRKEKLQRWRQERSGTNGGAGAGVAAGTATTSEKSIFAPPSRVRSAPTLQQSHLQRHGKPGEKERKEGNNENRSPPGAPPMTPCTRARTTRELVVKAKEFESDGNLRQASRLFEEARCLMPSNGSLRSKAEAVKVAMDDERSQMRKDRLEEIMKLLNEGTVKELQQLQGIGTKRANLIVDSRNFREITFHEIEDLKTVGFGKKLMETFIRENNLIAATPT
eukprot:TRINITY_DN6629_c0_g1_i1.p1 TRINITY_DN6629_c0_g1~~TRINITY_DN6629_c0_g1_i1.p1  ORF type:complete len:565 (+),score=86.79 TRINITY_DN6629_c0_g1_i1:74-1768(+)